MIDTKCNCSGSRLHFVCSLNSPGETLLELTERWRFLYRKLYDEDKDEFDLSRIPDIHDNVRFDMLHNREYHFICMTFDSKLMDIAHL